jgi:hypothetical protein
MIDSVGSITTDPFTTQLSTTVSIPSGISTGNVLVWFVAITPFGASSTSINTPTGWTVLIASSEIVRDANRRIRGGWFYRVVDGTEGSSATCTGSAPGNVDAFMCSFMRAYSGVDTSTPLDTSSTNSGNATGTTITATGFTAGFDGGMLIATITTWETDRGPLSGMTELANTGGKGATCDEQTGISAGAISDKTCSCSSTETWLAMLISLRPAATPVDTLFFGSGTTS